MFRAVTFLWFGLSVALAFEPPVFTAASIRNAASLEPGITVGAIVTITGLHLTNGAGVFAADRYPLPTTLGGTSVKIDGVPASLFSVFKVDEQDEITLQVPYSAAPLIAFGTADAGARILATVEVNNGNASTAVSSVWRRQQPGIFSLNGYPAIFHAGSGQMVTPENPAAPDEAVSIYTRPGSDTWMHLRLLGCRRPIFRPFEPCFRGSRSMVTPQALSSAGWRPVWRASSRSIFGCRRTRRAASLT